MFDVWNTCTFDLITVWVIYVMILCHQEQSQIRIWPALVLQKRLKHRKIIQRSELRLMKIFTNEYNLLFCIRISLIPMKLCQSAPPLNRNNIRQATLRPFTPRYSGISKITSYKTYAIQVLFSYKKSTISIHYS